MMSLFLNAILAFWGNGISSEAGQVWWYHPHDGTFQYSDCKVRGDWRLESQVLQINELSVLCDRSPGWNFEQAIKDISFERDAEVLKLSGVPVGHLLPNKTGFSVEFTDKWDDEHHVKVVARIDGSWRMEWFVSSSEYIAFDLLVNED